MAKPIALAADHGGFELKEAVKAHLDELGLEYIDFGTHSTASVDYPDMALPACDAVVSGQCDKALLFCNGRKVAPGFKQVVPVIFNRDEGIITDTLITHIEGCLEALIKGLLISGEFCII